MTGAFVGARLNVAITALPALITRAIPVQAASAVARALIWTKSQTAVFGAVEGGAHAFTQPTNSDSRTIVGAKQLLALFAKVRRCAVAHSEYTFAMV